MNPETNEDEIIQPWYQRRITILIAVVLLITLALYIAADESDPIPTSSQSTQVNDNRYPAILICDNLAEDSAMNPDGIKFERHDDGTVTLVYKCRPGKY